MGHYGRLPVQRCIYSFNLTCGWKCKGLTLSLLVGFKTLQMSVLTDMAMSRRVSSVVKGQCQREACFERAAACSLQR